MKAYKLLLLVFLCSVVHINKTFAQQEYPDYVITIGGDSIRCEIIVPLFGSVKYQSASMTKAEKIKPDAIKEYYIADENILHRAVFKDSTSKPMFMTVIEKGKLSLYEMVYNNYSKYGNTTTTEWYIGKGSDYVKDFKSSGIYIGKSRKERKDYLGDLLKDNQAVYNKYIAEDKFSFKQIQNLVHLYNTGQPLSDGN